MQGIAHALPMGIIAISGVLLLVVALALVRRRRRRLATRAVAPVARKASEVPDMRALFGPDDPDDDEPKDSCPAVAIAVDSTALDVEAAPSEPAFQFDAVGGRIEARSAATTKTRSW